MLKRGVFFTRISSNRINLLSFMGNTSQLIMARNLVKAGNILMDSKDFGPLPKNGY